MSHPPTGRVTVLVALALLGGVGAGSATLRPDGGEASVAAAVGRLAFASDRDGNLEIYVMNADGSGQRRLTHTSAFEQNPTWSSDGTRIAFGRSGGGTEQIYVMNADGSAVRRLSRGSARAQAPTWSPDGARILFTSSRDGNEEIYVMNADGTGVRRLTHSPQSDISPTWSPDGGKIAFARDLAPAAAPSQLDVYVMNADGSGERRLTDNRANDAAPAWSPNGRQIAFQSDRDGTMQVYVMNADGSAQHALAPSRACDELPAWSPDGGTIAFTSNRDAGGSPECAGPWEIYVMNADGGGQRRLTNNEAYDFTSASAWQPTGQAPRACRAADVRARLLPARVALGNVVRPVSLRNVGKSACLLSGYPRGLSANGKPLRWNRGTYFGDPGPAGPIASGRAAQLYVASSSACTSRPAAGVVPLRIGLPQGGDVVVRFPAGFVRCPLSLSRFGIPGGG